MLVEQVARCPFISTLDLRAGYWQIAMDPNSAALTAFATPRGLYQFTKMPFGLKGTSSTFQRLMNRVLNPYSEFATAYLDDLAIFSETWEQHLVHVLKVLTALRESGLTLKAAKCQFAQGKVQYLGHEIGNGQMRPVEAKVKCIQN